MTAERLRVVDSAGRAKAFRPLDVETRGSALTAGLDAYDRGDFFEAHELLEPAWMGTDDPGERAFLQGLIKLAAAYVHDVRGNPAGIAKNLTGARAWLVEASADGDGRRGGIDLDGLIGEIDRRLADLSAHADGPTLGPPELERSRS